ncbi:MAG: metallophosphoesterase [Bacteroidales bacterium]|nr:metallophosphoesterase [Bacteroidales bacterium]
MKLLSKVVVVIVAVMTCVGCDMMKYHPYSPYFEGASHLTESNLKAIEGLGLGTQYKFAFLSDTQRRYDDTDDAVADINARGDIDFVIHGGDLTDFGVTEEYVWMRDCLAALQMPYVSVIGNHDFLGNGEYIYQEMYGALNYAFTVGHVRYEMLNTVALELDYSVPVPDFGFLEDEVRYIDSINAISPDSLQRTVFVMHSRPGDEQFNNNVIQPFGRYLSMFPAPFCLNGHNHRFEVLDPYENGILFYGVTNIGDRGYYVVSINSDNTYEVERIDF